MYIVHDKGLNVKPIKSVQTITEAINYISQIFICYLGI